MSGSPVKRFAVPTFMASHRRILNISTGMYTDYDSAKQMVEDWCACGWVDKESIRSLSTEEARIARMERDNRPEVGTEVLVRTELSGLTFEKPKTTRYRPPSREVYEELDSPLALTTCKWPRKEWPSRSHVDQVIAQMETLS